MLLVNEFTTDNSLKFSEENKSCAICMVNYEVGEKYMILECLHRFHECCVKEWFKQMNTCPICKALVYQDDEFNSHS
ncbi:MAG: RING finger domain-containing protein [Flammeovirgaceae bacterium]